MKDRRPWYRASKDAWFVEINGKQVRLYSSSGSRRSSKGIKPCQSKTRPGTPYQDAVEQRELMRVRGTACMLQRHRRRRRRLPERLGQGHSRLRRRLQSLRRTVRQKRRGNGPPTSWSRCAAWPSAWAAWMR